MAKLKNYRFIASEVHIFNEVIQAKTEDEAQEKFMAMLQEGLEADDVSGFQIDQIINEGV